MEYGLIGEHLGHSFSAPIHEQLGGYPYALCPLRPDEVAKFFEEKAFRGINVTIPYKETVMAYCDVIDQKAQDIGAVNTIVNRDGKLYGYNTDFDGVLYLLGRHNIDLAGKRVMVLGSGGTSKTVCAVARYQKAREVVVVSREEKAGLLSYTQAKSRKDIEVIINTSPVGMYPANDDMPIDPAHYPKLSAVADVIYNPLRTSFVLAAKARGLTAVGGLEMLVSQAAFAVGHFLGREIEQGKVDDVYQGLLEQKANIVLIGMPSSGKTSVGKNLAKAFSRKFIDIDAEIKKEANMPITEIFEKFGEEGFRHLEEKVAARFAKEGCLVISTGGGTIKREQSVLRLRQNGVVFYLDRRLNLLKVGGNRPLSTDFDRLAKLKSERAPLYEKAADYIVKNNGQFKLAVKKIEESYHEIIRHQWA